MARARVNTDNREADDFHILFANFASFVVPLLIPFA